MELIKIFVINKFSVNIMNLNKELKIRWLKVMNKIVDYLIKLIHRLKILKNINIGLYGLL